jgi:hypothetical protein
VEHQTLLLKIQQSLQDGSSYLNLFPLRERERGTAALYGDSLILAALTDLRACAFLWRTAKFGVQD